MAFAETVGGLLQVLVTDIETSLARGLGDDPVGKNLQSQGRQADLTLQEAETVGRAHARAVGGGDPSCVASSHRKVLTLLTVRPRFARRFGVLVLPALPAFAASSTLHTGYRPDERGHTHERHS